METPYRLHKSRESARAQTRGNDGTEEQLTPRQGPKP
ncbi:uncharacterized protein G2W53_014172 [Senna tora]|uniref:Uncharacterized protein n=1 Tax=Senna tora TaxID=362788 RepID=A0A835C3Q5_9FABA|nr:uncharacterized protein G2W53_014154 [Senna tora]KAF7831833.1 uncharacterized protein G2W53_014166 [Senna tora]KAF7831839.1 uncharacterized protein G2W53_014172 [Senna tora]